MKTYSALARDFKAALTAKCKTDEAYSKALTACQKAGLQVSFSDWKKGRYRTVNVYRVVEKEIKT